MSTPTDIERTSYGGPNGSLALGTHQQVIQSVGATRTLKASESGALCLFDVATGVVYTLPTPVEGMKFEFLATVAVTSNAYKVITAAITTQFLLGAVLTRATDPTKKDVFQADGTSSHVAISSNGTTTGGLIGSHFTLTAISTTQWVISGTLVGSGTIATPFAAS